MNGLLVVLGWLWTSPNTLAWALVARCRGARPVRLWGAGWVWHVIPGTSLAASWSAPSLVDGDGRPMRKGAMTIGTVVVIQPDCDPRLLPHEVNGHVRQAMILGPLYALIYGLGCLWALAIGGDAYWDNPLERAARRAAGEE